MMPRLARKAFWAVVFGIAAGFVPTAASAKDLCLQTTDTLDTVIVLTNFQIKKGTTFQVSGWVVKSFFPIELVEYSPVSGPAIAPADGSRVVLALTQGNASIFRSQGSLGGSSLGVGAIIHAINLAVVGGDVSGGNGSRLSVGDGGNQNQTPPHDHLTVVNCSGDLDLP